MKTALGVIGILLIVGTLGVGNLSHIGDWSTSEMIGYNVWSVVAIFGGGYLTYRGFRGKKATDLTSEKK